MSLSTFLYEKEKNIFNSRDFSASFGCFTASTDQCPKVVDIVKLGFCVFGKLKLSNQVIQTERNSPKLVAGANKAHQKPRLLLVLAAVPIYNTMCELVERDGQY